MKKAFFGGSFDPPHCGHLGVARAAIASGKCDEVVWFPGYTPPHKLSARRAPFEDRMNMIRLLIKNEPQMKVSDFENRIRLSPSYTIDVLKCLEKETGEKFSLLIGADSLLSLHTWHEAAELVEYIDLITYPRDGFEVIPEKLTPHWDAKTVKKLLKSMIPGTFFKISSTEMKISMEKNGFRHHIIKMEDFPPEIAEYIREHRLYQCAATDHGKGIL